MPCAATGECGRERPADERVVPWYSTTVGMGVSSGAGSVTSLADTPAKDHYRAPPSRSGPRRRGEKILHGAAECH